MITTQPGLPLLVAVACIVAMTSACRSKTPASLSGTRENVYPPPVARPFVYAAKNVEVTHKTRTLRFEDLPSRSFDLNRLPAKPFYTGEALPLTHAPEQTPLTDAAFRDSAFSVDKVSPRPLRFKLFALPAPHRVKASPPRARQGSARGVMEMGSEEGLTGSIITFSIVDRYGLLWLATDKGVCYYDGEYCEQISIGRGFNSAVATLYEDSSGNIWIGSRSGRLFVLDRTKRLLKQVINLPADGQNPLLMSITEDGQRRLWVSAPNVGVAIIDPAKKTLRVIKPTIIPGIDRSFRIMRDRQNRIWVGNAVTGLQRFDLRNNVLSRSTPALHSSIKGVFGLLEDHTGNIWVGAGLAGFYKLDFRQKTVTRFGKDQGLGHRYAVTLSERKNGEIWIGTDSTQLTVYDPLKKTIEQIRPMNGTVPVVSITEDPFGQVWLGMPQGGGGFMIKRQNGRPGNFSRAQGLTDNNIWALYEDPKNRMWIGTYNGIDVYDPSQQLIRHAGAEQGLGILRYNSLLEGKPGEIWAAGNGTIVHIFDTEKKTLRSLGQAGELGENNTSRLFRDSHDRIWIGAFNGTVQYLDRPTNTLHQLEASPFSSSVSFFAEDTRGNIWIGFYGGGICILDPSLRTFNRMTVASGLASDQVTDLLPDANGMMWLASEGGIQRVNLTNRTIQTFGAAEGLPVREVYAITKRNGVYYFGSSSGLAVIGPLPAAGNTAPWPVRIYQKSQGLAYLDFNQNALMFNRQGSLWAGVEQTLLVMDEPVADTLASQARISQLDILGTTASFLSGELPATTGKDTVWLAGTDSVYSTSNNAAHRLAKGISWSGTQGPFNLPTDLVLPYDQNYLTFRFTGSQLGNPGQQQYRYLLEGIDQDWSAITDKGVSDNYRNLPPGDYTFRVIARGFNSRWSRPAELSFRIRPPWWSSVGAWMAYLVLFAAAVRAYIAYRSRHLRRQNRELEDRVARRTDELNRTIENLQTTQSQLIQSEKMASLGELTAGIAHEIQNPLNFVNNFAEVSTELAEELRDELRQLPVPEDSKAELYELTDSLVQNQQKINFHGKRADSIVKGMLQHSRANIGQQELTDLNALADEYFRLSYHGLRAKDKSFNAEMQSDLEDHLGKASVVSQEIGRVILNMFNNAFYAVNKRRETDGPSYMPRVTLSTRKVTGTDGKALAEISIRDNGIGIPASVKDKIFQPFFTTKPTGQGTGLGLSLSYDIVKAHGGEIAVHSTEGEGTEMVVRLPLV